MSAESPSPASGSAARPRILVVEDELLVRDFVEVSLADAGYDVLSVDPKDALATLNEQGATLGALVTDIRLGSGILGWHVATHARGLHPQMPVVYMSGDCAADWLALGVPESLMLQKPFASAQLAVAVSDLLNKTVLRPASRPYPTSL